MRYLALWISIALTAFPATRYVDNAATGANNGTSWANAWTAMSSVTASAGDTVYVSGGTTTKIYDPQTGGFHTWIPSDSGNGSSGNPIVYKVGQDAGHNGTIIFDGQGIGTAAIFGAPRWLVISGDYGGSNHWVLTNYQGGAVTLDGSSSIVLDHLTAYGKVRFNPGTNITVNACYVKPPAPIDPCIFWNVWPDADPGSITNNVVSNSQIVMPASDNTPVWGSDGISGGGRTMLITNNFFSCYYVTNDTEWQHCDGLQVLAGQTTGLGSTVKIVGNVFENIANYGVYWEMFGNVTNVQVLNNWFRNNSTFAHANQLTIGVAMGYQGVSSKVANALVIANNTFVDYFGRAAVTFGGAALTNTYIGCVLANNLMVNSGNGSTAALDAQDSSGTNGIAIYNNRAVAKARGTTSITPSQLVTPGGSATDLQVYYYAELSPLNDLRLLSNDAAAKGYGADLSSIFTTDIAGRTRSAPWDIGAYAYYAPPLQTAIGGNAALSGSVQIR